MGSGKGKARRVKGSIAEASASASVAQLKVLLNGTKQWLDSNGKLHRVDGPAIEYVNGDKYWSEHGQWHRVDGPAIEYSNGTKQWYLCDKHHRVGGPAIELANGNKEWYQNGKPHREDGPAMEYADGYKAWYVNGEFHREDGPAREFPDGKKEYWINGKQVGKNKMGKQKLTEEQLKLLYAQGEIEISEFEARLPQSAELLAAEKETEKLVRRSRMVGAPEEQEGSLETHTRKVSF